MSKKKECHDIIKEWQNTFASNTKKGQYFLNFKDKEEQVIKPTYAKGGSWLPFIGFTNSLCTCFTCMTTSHAPIGEYHQRFFPHSPISCPCSKAKIQTHEHIIMECPWGNEQSCLWQYCMTGHGGYIPQHSALITVNVSMQHSPQEQKHSQFFLYLLVPPYVLLFSLLFTFSI